MPLKVDVSVDSRNCARERRFETADASESGVSLRGAAEAFAIGDIVSLRVNGLLYDRSPRVNAQVVRQTGQGVALNYLN